MERDFCCLEASLLPFQEDHGDALRCCLRRSLSCVPFFGPRLDLVSGNEVDLESGNEVVLVSGNEVVLGSGNEQDPKSGLPSDVDQKSVIDEEKRAHALWGTNLWRNCCRIQLHGAVFHDYGVVVTISVCLETFSQG